MITQSFLKSILNYNPDTGIFTWKIKPAQCVKIGDVAGYIDKSTGYISIGINKKLYRAHRLAWLYIHGEFPIEEIDHINHDRSDNRIDNLRAVSHKDNGKNVSKRKDNTSGHLGIYWDKRRNKWHTQIKVKNKVIYLGLFTDIIEAIAVRKKAEIKYNFHQNHGVAA